MRVDALPMGADPADRCVQGVSDGLSGAVFGDWASSGWHIVHGSADWQRRGIGVPE